MLSWVIKRNRTEKTSSSSNHKINEFVSKVYHFILLGPGAYLGVAMLPWPPFGRQYSIISIE